MKLYQKLNEIRSQKENKKGFTLVELIVVIVILAILAAILVPALLGYIDKAKEGQYELEAKSVYMAMQAEASELYAKHETYKILAPSDFSVADIQDTADVTGLTIVNLTSESTAETAAAETNPRKLYNIKTLTITFVSSKGGSPVTMQLADGTWSKGEIKDGAFVKD